MCEQCHYLTDILISITDDNVKLRGELSTAIADDDVERIVTLQKAIEETFTQVLINQTRMQDHLVRDHSEEPTTPAQRRTQRRAEHEAQPFGEQPSATAPTS